MASAPLVRNRFTPFRLVRGPFSTEAAGKEALARVDEKVHSAKIVVLMKGVPDAPQCGFSNAVCRVLEMHGVLDAAKSESVADGAKPLFKTYNILEDEELRAAAKVYADWPTFPQVYINGEFIGGCDIIIEQHKSGLLVDDLKKAEFASKLA